MALPPSLDVSVEDGLGESLQRGHLVGGEAGPLVEERDAGRVSGQHPGVRVAQHLEVVVDGVSDHHLAHQQPKYLLPGLDVRRGVDEVSVSDAAPPGPVVRDGHGGVDELIVDHVSVVRHQAAAGQLADAALRPRAHHLTVDGQELGGHCC